MRHVSYMMIHEESLLCLNHVARSLKAFEEIGSILGLDYIDEALRRHLKIPADDAFDIRAWSCCLKGLCQYVVRRCKKSKTSRIPVLHRLKATVVGHAYFEHCMQQIST